MSHVVLEVGDEPIGVLVETGCGFVLVTVNPLSPLNERAFESVLDARAAVRNIAVSPASAIRSSPQAARA